MINHADRYRWPILLVLFASLFAWNNRTIASELAHAGTIHVGDLIRFNVLPIFFSAWMGLGFLTLGRFSLGFFPGSQTLAFDRKAVLSFALGAGICGYAVMLLGFAGKISPLSIGILFGLSSSIGVFRWGNAGWNGLAAMLKEWREEASSFENALILSVLAWGLFYGFLQALLPASGTEDAVAYHLVIPKVWAVHGKVDYIPWMINANWPMHTYMLYIPAMVFGADTTANFIHYFFALGCLLAMLSFGKDWVSGRARFFAAASLVSFPLITQIIGIARNDFSWTFYVFLTGLCLALPDEKQKKMSLILAGIFGGLAASCRYQGLGAVGILGIVGLAFPQLIGRSRKDMVPFFALVALVGSPWYIRNWIVSGNPVLPFLYKVFGGKNWSDYNNYLFAFEGRRYATYWERLFFPFQNFSSYLVHLYHPLIAGYVSHYFYLPLIALVLLTWKRFPNLLMFFSMAYLLFLPLIVKIPETWWRFTMPFAMSGCLLAGWLREQPSRFWKHAPVLVAWVILVPALFIRFRTAPTALLGIRDPAAPQETAREYYLRRTSVYYPIEKRINESLEPNARVLLYREIYGYYIDRDIMWGSPGDQGLIQYHDLKTGEQLYGRLKELSVSHILVNYKSWGVDGGYGDFYTKVSDPQMGEVLARHGQVVLEEGTYKVWKLI